MGHYINDRRLFQDGVFFVDLRGAASSEAVRFSLSTALGVEAKEDRDLFAIIRQHYCLLVLDNCEDPLYYLSSDFRKFLTQLLRETKYVSLLLTTRHALGGGIPGTSEKVHHLRQLDKQSAARLFVKLAPPPPAN